MARQLQLVKPICKRVGCSKYGEQHSRCKAHTAHNAFKPCERWPAKGQFVCALHGGKTPNGKRAGQMRQAIAEVEQVKSLGARLVATDANFRADPEEGLLRLYTQSVQICENLESIVAEFDKAQLTHTTNARDVRFTPFYNAWTEERKFCAQMAKSCLDAGIAKREIALAEQQAVQIVQVFQLTVTDPVLALTSEQIIDARILFGQKLRSNTVNATLAEPDATP